MSEANEGSPQTTGSAFQPILTYPTPEMIASAIAHRACCGSEHDPSSGKLHGYCVVCGVPWPCETASTFLVKPVVRPTPDYKLSFGISFTEELIAAGYCKEGVCKMDNGIEGIVFCRRPNAIGQPRLAGTTKEDSP